MSTNPLSFDYCKECTGVLKTLESCPRWYILDSGDVMEIALELIWFLASFLPLFVYLAILIYSIAKKNTRGCYILFNVFIQQIICAFMKLYVAQARPKGACSSSFGFPSGHSGFASAMATWFILEIIFFSQNAAFKQGKFYSYSRNIFIILAPLIPISRYFLNYHTVEQIVCGLLTGVFSTVFFFGICFGFGTKEYESILAKFFSKYRNQDKYLNQDDAPHEYAKEPEIASVWMPVKEVWL